MSGTFDIFGLGADPENPGESPARKAQIASARPLPKRFYTSVSHVEDDDGFLLQLDGRPVRTPARALLKVASRPVIERLVEEWSAQRDHIDPKTMPLTRLVNSAIDGVAANMAEVRAEIVRFSGTDLLCYRAEAPERLVARQSAHWDPVLRWAEAHLNGRFLLAAGVIHVAQPGATLKAVDNALARIQSPLDLAALHTMTTLMGSFLLALAVREGQLTTEEAWRSAHIDEDWNIEQWGEDADAQHRRAYRFAEMKAAAIAVRAASL